MKSQIKLFIFLFSAFLYGQQISQDQIQTAAQHWLIQTQHTEFDILDIKPVFYRSETVMYAVELSPTGFILFSATKNTIPLLAYSFENIFDFNNPVAQAWMESYYEQIYRAIKNGNDCSQTVQEWEELLSPPRRQIQLNSSYLTDAMWDQDCGWNEYTPEDSRGPCGHTVTGCVATAMAIIMKYWEHPAACNSIPGYTDGENDDASNSSYGWISGIPPTVYNWNAMSDISPTSAAALLIYHAGVAVHMNYGPESSSAYSGDAKNALKNYFGYSPELSLIYKMYYTESQWNNILIDQINQNRPVYYRGQDSDANIGHAFVLDGYDGNGRFHFNWGWAGSCNGWYYLNDLSPSSCGDDTYSDYQAAIIDIYPSTLPHPDNDLCENAEEITSSTDCQFTSGTVDNAGYENYLPQGNCDYASSPAMKDVFYTFTAVSPSHVITVTPEDDMDPVIVLYEGTTCQNLQEVACADSGGGNGEEEILEIDNLTVGETYYIRVYDYGNISPTNGNFQICVTHTETEETCDAPENIYETNLTATSVTLVIPPNDNAEEYKFRFYDGSSATNYYSSDNTYDISDLSPETQYRWKAKIKCDGEWTDYSDYSYFTTPAETRRTYVPDDNFEQALIRLRYDDTMDDYVDTDNIENITSLYISHQNISDLTGIEDFLALEELYCEGNNLTSVDFASNIYLQKLWIGRNPLTELRIENNMLLTELGCAYTQLESLDLSEHENLRIFEGYSINTLSELNVKNGNNEILTSFMAIRNPNLYCITVDNAAAANNGTGVYANWDVDDQVSFSENCGVGIEDMIKNKINVYPVPSENFLFIMLEAPLKISEIYLIDLTGQRIKEFPVSQKLDIRFLKKGIYFLQLTINDTPVTFKIIKL